MDSKEAQSLLKPLSLDEIRHWISRKKISHRDPVIFRAHYLAYLCARGDYNIIKNTLAAFSCEQKELKQLLNCSIYVMCGDVPVYSGTVLHVALYWNTDQVALDLYQLLTEHGATISRNYYGEYPWVQTGGNWTNPVTGERYGERDDSEFDDTYDELIRLHGLRKYDTIW